MLRFVSTNMGVSEHRGSLIWVVLIIRILLLRVRYQGPLFSETPKLSPKDLRTTLDLFRSSPIDKADGFRPV